MLCKVDYVAGFRNPLLWCEWGGARGGWGRGLFGARYNHGSRDSPQAFLAALLLKHLLKATKSHFRL